MKNIEKYIVVMFEPGDGCSYRILESSSEKDALLQVLASDYEYDEYDENTTAEELMEKFCDWTDGHILVEKLCLE